MRPHGDIGDHAKALHPQLCALANAITAALYIPLLFAGHPNSETITGTLADGATHGCSIGEGLYGSEFEQCGGAAPGHVYTCIP